MNHFVDEMHHKLTYLRCLDFGGTVQVIEEGLTSSTAFHLIYYILDAIH